MGKYRRATIGIPEAKGLLTSVNGVLGQETSWVNLEKYTVARKLVDGMRQLIQEAATEPTRCILMMTGYPSYMELIDASGQGCG